MRGDVDGGSSIYLCCSVAEREVHDETRSWYLCRRLQSFRIAVVIKGFAARLIDFVTSVSLYFDRGSATCCLKCSVKYVQRKMRVNDSEMDEDELNYQEVCT
ncbi:hypothetical protein NPIL_595741 [Nephila pilipes]|uniref:Uncharacterized protein n=1 Tax=Nephila pilipes TaxID=299642 RepID=A0A8X6UDL5_NEPPI|nr:hypothetical protein NPIL_595741 [Nephila pilipes]